MKQGDTIKLSNGEKATITVGDESPNFNNIYVVRLENGDLRVVDRKTLTLAPAKNHDNFSNYGKIR
ncbi:bacteriocin [Lactococcus garvieae]|uniref:bacteriocin n=1 Tax=Lactococcus garvieae TaxID=1363 RepID=UPI001F624451|nr:bacteriocin [Lactococcus garvieae]MCI3860791.1 bacteriocin [Lactococcus garvieae]